MLQFAYYVEGVNEILGSGEACCFLGQVERMSVDAPQGLLLSTLQGEQGAVINGLPDAGDVGFPYGAERLRAVEADEALEGELAVGRAGGVM